LNHTENILDTTTTIDMPVYPKTLSFCYIEYQKIYGDKTPYVICNYVELSQKKLETVRDFLENYSSQK